MDRQTEISDHFMHVGAGTGTAPAWVGLIPGVIPMLALTAVVVAVLALPFVVLGLAVAVVAGPPYAIWPRLTRGRRRRPKLPVPGPRRAPRAGVS